MHSAAILNEDTKAKCPEVSVMKYFSFTMHAWQVIREIGKLSEASHSMISVQRVKNDDLQAVLKVIGIIMKLATS